MSAVPTNILETISGELDRRGLGNEVGVVMPRAPSGNADVVLAGGPSIWRQGGSGSSVVDDVEALAEVERIDVNRKRRRAKVCLSPAWITAMATSLELGERDALYVDDLAVGRDLAIDFCDPNATKAFHVGHLRNLALGNALAAVASAAGAEVTKISYVGDMGRSMGEAMAGYLAHADDGEPQDQKGDHFVGAHYSRYTQGLGSDSQGPDADGDLAAAMRELVEGDLADELLTRWAAGDAEVEELWDRLRGWVIDGHDETLTRLGIEFDQLIFESDYAGEIESFVERALESGVAVRAADGTVGFETGRDEYPYLLFERADGQRTQLLRVFALWHATFPSFSSSEAIQVIGEEWMPLKTFADPILNRLEPHATTHPDSFVVHGMVLADGEKISSSAGSAWLADELLDDLCRDPLLKELAAISERTPLDELVNIVALSFFLTYPHSTPMTASREKLCDHHSNPGWSLAEAWAEAWDPRHDGDPDPDLEDFDYRFLVVQAQLHRRFVAVALETLDVKPLLRFHSHLCRWYLNEPRSARVSRSMRTVLREALSTLGLRRAGALTNVTA